MSQEWKKIVIRSFFTFSLFFCGIVLVMQIFGSSKYRGSSSFVLFANTEISAQQLAIITQNISLILQGPLFKDRVAGSFYEETEEWKQFSLEVKNPTGSVIVVEYEDQSVDPYAVREAVQSLRMQVVKTLAAQYDLSQDLSLRFIDEGQVYEVDSSFGSFVNAFIFSMAITFLVEGLLYWRFLKESERTFRLAVKKRMAEGSIYSEWWKQFEPKKSSPEISQDLELSVTQGIISAKEEQKKISSEEKKVSSLPSERRHVTAMAPANLPIAVDIPETVQPYPEYKEAVMRYTKESDLLVEDETALSEESLFETEGAMFVEKSTSSVPSLSLEPSDEELKERLNKLLRGEL